MPRLQALWQELLKQVLFMIIWLWAATSAIPALKTLRGKGNLILSEVDCRGKDKLRRLQVYGLVKSRGSEFSKA